MSNGQSPMLSTKSDREVVETTTKHFAYYANDVLGESGPRLVVFTNLPGMELHLYQNQYSHWWLATLVYGDGRLCTGGWQCRELAAASLGYWFDGCVSGDERIACDQQTRRWTQASMPHQGMSPLERLMFNDPAR
jgi:hypothetical protein